MKKLLLASLILIAMATPTYFVSQHQKVVVKEIPVTVTKMVTQTVPAVVPSYHVGDTQQGITLVGVYPYSYQNVRGGNGDTPPTVSLLYFALSGIGDIAGHTQVLNNEGNFLATDGPVTIPACGNNPCVGYIVIDKPTTFYYQDLKWQL